jgi:hypothetical protein
MAEISELEHLEEPLTKLEDKLEKLNYKLEQYRQAILWMNLLNSNTTQKTYIQENS